MSADKVGTGYVPIKPDADGFGRDLEQQLDREGTPAASKSGKKVGGAFSNAMKGVALAGAGVLAKSVIDFGGFEKQMNEVFTLLPGISGDAMGKMTDQVKSFSTEFGVLPTQVVPALYQSLSAGVPKDNVFAFLETAQKLAKGGVTDLTTAVDGLSSVVNAYGADVLPASKASDLMFTTVKLGKTTIDELSASLFQVTPTAAGLGIGFDQVTASLAAMTLQGVPTTVATTQLRQLFIELSKAGGETATTFEGLAGKSFRDFIAGGGNVQGALQLLEAGAADAGLSISDMFGSVEAGSAALALTGGGTEAFTNSLAGMQDSAGATEAAFDTMNQGLSATLDKLKARFSVAFLNIGEALAPTIEVLGGFLVGFLDVFSQIPGPLQAIVLIIGTVTAGLIGFAGPILKAIDLFKKLGGVFSMLAANPWILVLAGLVLVTILIVKNWDKVKTALSAVWDWMRSAGKAVADFFVGLWNGATSAISTAWNGLADFFRQWWPLLLGIFTGGIGTIVLLVVQNWDAIFAKISGVMTSIVDAVQGAWSTVWGIVSGIGGQVVGFITGIPKAITGAFSTLAGIISAPFVAAFNLIKTVWNSTVGGFGFKTPDWIPFVGGKSFTIPSMAAGGVLSGPQMFLGGEYPGAARNPEIVTPQNIMRETVTEAITATGAAGGVTVNLTMNVASEVRDPGFFERQAVELTRVVVRELERSNLGRGTVLAGSNR